MKKTRSWKALLLALTLTLGLVVPAQAAEVRLTGQKSGNSAALTIQGLGEESIYGVQLELTLAGNYPSATFVPTEGEVYSPECRVAASDRNTRVVIYLTSQTPLNSGGTLPVGTLTMPRSFTLPSSVTMTLLGHELKPLSSVNAAAVSVQEVTQDTADEGDEDTSPAEYRVRISSALHGQVKADTTWAAVRSTVTLTVTPEDRYALEELKVTGENGREMSLTDVGGDRYTFRMPTGNVEVTATFQWTGQSHVSMNFSDVTETDWYHSAVHYVYENGMMSGTSESTFSPDMATSRGMLVTILHRMEGTPEAESAGFTDVEPEKYYAEAIDWAYANGVVSGYGGNESGTFGPEYGVTREQLATILYRYTEGKGWDTAPRGDLTAFADWETISDYAVEAMSWAVGEGLISGMGDGSVAPGGSATRAQVATILTRYSQIVAQ